MYQQWKHLKEVFEIKIIQDLCSVSHGPDFHQNAIKALKANLGPRIFSSSKHNLTQNES